MNTAPMRAYIEARSIPEPNTGCWLWMLSLGSHQYPQGFNGTTVVLAHRFSYEAFVGAIPENYEVDHKCKNRSCVNPDHLEATTKIANRRRQFGYFCEADLQDDACPKGHPYRRVSGKVVCNKCALEHQKIYRARDQGSKQI